MDLDQVLEAHTHQLSTGEKIKYSVYGSVIGVLHPDVQHNITKNFYASAWMSTTSRIVNATTTLFLLGAKALGYDFDPTPGNILTWGLLADTVIREASYACVAAVGDYGHSYHDPWGEPITSWITDHYIHKQK